MRRMAIWVLLLTSLLTGCWKPPKTLNWKNAPGAEQYERLMWQAIRDKKWTEVEYHLAPLFVGVDANGRKLDRAAWVEHWKSQDVRDLSLGDLAVEPNGPDMVVTYTLNLAGSEGAPHGVRVVSVWQQLKKGWVMTTQSFTPIR
jgi:Domain of unknown function (DUF4440)